MFANLDAFEQAARERLPQSVYDYYAGGAEDERTVRANREAFQQYAFLPRILVDVARVDSSVELLGQRIAHPILIAPTAFQRLAHEDGELATVRAACSANTIYIASTLSTCTLEEIAAAARGANLWFQLYVFKDRSLTEELIARARAAGYRALCLTATVPVQGKRERDARNRFGLPEHVAMANFRGLAQSRMPQSAGSSLEAYIASVFDPSLTWDTLDWLIEHSELPVVLKGCCHPDDARRALDAGVSAVIVSNHGGRQLDSAVATLDALPEVVAAVGDKIPVLMDGGIRRGGDVLKALALGATATLIGRPVLWGLSVGGQAGVEAVLDTLNTELDRTMALCGLTDLSSLNASLLRRSTHGPVLA